MKKDKVSHLKEKKKFEKEILGLIYLATIVKQNRTIAIIKANNIQNEEDMRSSNEDLKKIKNENSNYLLELDRVNNLIMEK